MVQVITFNFEEKEFADMASRIRTKVFVDEQGVSKEAEHDLFDQSANHILAFSNQEPVGVARWRETSNGIKLERFAVLKEFRNKGIGALMLNKIIREIKNSNKTIYLHSQIAAVNFYKRAGFSVAGDMFTEANIQHYKMIWKG